MGRGDFREEIAAKIYGREGGLESWDSKESS